MRDNGRIIQANSRPRHQQFFRRNRRNLQAPPVPATDDPHIIHGGTRHPRSRVNMTRISHRHLHFTIRIRVQHRQRSVIQTAHINGLDFYLRIPVKLDDPGFANQGILEGGIENLKAWIIARQHIIDVVRRLFRCRHIFWAIGDELNNLLATKEYTHQARQDRLHRVAHIAANHLGPPIFLVPEWHPSVVLSRHRPQWRDGAVNVINRVFNLTRHDSLNINLIWQFSIHASVNRHILHHACQIRHQIGNLRVHVFILTSQAMRGERCCHSRQHNHQPGYMGQSLE